VKRDQVLFKIDPAALSGDLRSGDRASKFGQSPIAIGQGPIMPERWWLHASPGAISQQDVDKYLAAQAKAEAEVAAQQANSGIGAF